MAKDRREQDRQEAESKRQAAEQMVQARESLGYGGVKVVEPASEPFDLRLVIIRLNGIGFGWIVVKNLQSTAYYTLMDTRWDLAEIARTCGVLVLADGDFTATRRGAELEISFLTVGSSDEGKMTQALIDVLRHR